MDPTAAELFGDEGTPIGSPQMMIIDHPDAFLEGRTEEGALKVSERYLEEKGIYPLQLQTVRLFTGTARIASLLAGALCALIWAFVVIRMRGRSEKDQPPS